MDGFDMLAFVCSPATITSQYKIIIGWIPFLHRSIVIFAHKYINEKCNIQLYIHNQGVHIRVKCVLHRSEPANYRLNFNSSVVITFFLTFRNISSNPYLQSR